MLLLNADLGESWYTHRIGDDAALLPYLDCCNLACGFHGGDALTLQHTIELANHHGVAIGAHPSFPDRKHFGRQPMHLSPERLYALLLYQVSALQGMVRALTGAPLHHLKPHGALYHYANQHPAAARATARVAQQLDIQRLMGPPEGRLREASGTAGLGYLAEGFADRVYEPSLRLRSRSEPDACIDDPGRAAAQAYEMAAHHRVRDAAGQYHTLAVDTICLHGDHAGAAERAGAIRDRLASIPPR